MRGALLPLLLLFLEARAGKEKLFSGVIRSSPA
jgi:hypothetical protein